MKVKEYTEKKRIKIKCKEEQTIRTGTATISKVGNDDIEMMQS